jgi:hypothetical protein
MALLLGQHGGQTTRLIAVKDEVQHDDLAEFAQREDEPELAIAKIFKLQELWGVIELDQLLQFDCSCSPSLLGLRFVPG